MAKKSISANLNETLGGIWKHIPFQEVWVCDDDKRYIQATYTTALGMFDDDDNDRTFSGYYLYGGNTVTRAEQYMFNAEYISEHTLDFI